MAQQPANLVRMPFSPRSAAQVCEKLTMILGHLTEEVQVMGSVILVAPIRVRRERDAKIFLEVLTRVVGRREIA
jgi:hypothetical protein